MDISTHGSPVLTDPGPIAKSRLGLHSSLLLYSPTPSSFAATVLSRSYSRKKLIPSKLNDIHAHSWLDSMKASSPPRRTFVRDFDNIKQDGPEAAYQSWTLRYPSALTTFEKFAAAAEGKQLALFLDYDGTLSPIVDDPDRAFMSDEMREVVKEVAKCVPTAIISGRSRNKVFEFVGLPELYYAGSHGMDIMGPPKNGQSVDEVLNCTRSTNCIRTTDKQGKEVNLFQPASEFLPMIEEVFTTLQETTRDINGVLVENNKFCVSVHYRNVEEEKWPTVAECVEDVLRNYSRLRLTHGRKVLEIRPTIAWDKGKAVEFLLDSLCLTSSDKVLPIYIGDDRTDEDAFKVLRQSSRGCGILVSTVPKETNAFYSLRDPAEVMEFLKNLVSWKKPAAAN